MRIPGTKRREPGDRGRDRRRDPVESRRRILDAAEELFAENGFDGTPTARIAQRAGVPKGLLFHYFATKIDLLLALVAERADAEAIGRLRFTVVPGDVAGTLTRLAERFRDSPHGSTRMRRIVFREAETHPEVGALVGRLYAEAVGVIRSAIDAALDTPAPTPAGEDRAAAAEAFAAVLIHESGLGPLTGTGPDVPAVARLLGTALEPTRPPERGTATA